MSPRVLIACQGDPRLAPGGAEMAAWRLCEALRGQTPCWFLGSRNGADPRRARLTQPYGPRDYLYAAPAPDWFSLANRDPDFPAAFAALLDELRPDVVHLHGLGNLGAEALGIARRCLPAARIVLTLHEYLPICAHHGLMLTRPARAPCPAAAPAACAACFPEREPADFALRARYLGLFLDAVDRFIAPSAFLRDRYVAWGLPPGRITVLENAAPAATPLDGREPDGVLRVGFFGQLSPLKGLGVLLDAARRLEGRGDIAFALHGGAGHLPAELEAESRALLAARPGNVAPHGPYPPAELAARMAACDLVAVPSLWPENAPVVITEALAHGRPVIASAIGGIPEFVREGRDGFLLPPGDAPALARRLECLAAMPHKLAELRETLRAPPPPGETAARHLALYRDAR